MTSSQTRTATQTSTYARVVYVTRKLQADLFNLVDTYGQISESYAKHLISDLRIMMDEDVLEWVRLYWTKAGLSDVEFAYEYKVLDGYSGLVDDRSGGIRYRSNLANLEFGVRISKSSRWYELTTDEQNEIKGRLYFPWGAGETLTYSKGGFASDRTYAKDDYGFQRSAYGA